MTQRPLPLLLISAFVLLGTNGLTLTLIAIRAPQEGFSATAVGLLGTAYYVGILAGCLATTRLVRRAGHIRVFAALSALSAIAILAVVVVPTLPVWLAGRAVTGFALCGVSMVLESWLNQLATSGNRGRIMSYYRLADLSAVTGAQFLLPVVGTGGFEIFALAAMLYCLALMPVSLSRLSSPEPPSAAGLQPFGLFALSPVAFLGCVTVGLVNGAFRTVGPVYATGIGMTVEDVALFMTMGILGGALFQFPLGWLSDRIDRRWVLIMATAGAAAASALLATTPATFWIFAGALLFGSFAMPLYSLSAAHAYDHARPDQFIQLAAALALFFSLGACVGPFVAALIMDSFGPSGFFTYATALHGGFVVIVLYRMTRRAAVPRALRRGFVALMRTTSPTAPNMSRDVGTSGPAASEPVTRSAD